MDKVINLGIPHVAELIFENIDTPGLLQCVLVSETWKILAENVLIKRWKGRMFEACQSGNAKIVKLLLEFCNTEEELNTNDIFGDTALHIASRNGHLDVVQLILEHSDKIELNEKNMRSGKTAFMHACTFGHRDVVEFFLSYPNIELNARCNNGVTAFMLACNNGHKDVVQLLMNQSDKNIVVDAKSNNGMTAFMMACDRGQKDVIQLLLNLSDKTIELNARRNDGMTAFMMACSHGHKDVIQLLQTHSNKTSRGNCNCYYRLSLSIATEKDTQMPRSDLNFVAQPTRQRRAVTQPSRQQPVPKGLGFFWLLFFALPTLMWSLFVQNNRTNYDGQVTVNLKDRFGPSFEPFEPFKHVDYFEPFEPLKIPDFRMKWIKSHFKAMEMEMEIFTKYAQIQKTTEKLKNRKNLEDLSKGLKKSFMTYMNPEPDLKAFARKAQIQKTTEKLKNREEIVEREDLNVLFEICLNSNDSNLCDYLRPRK